MLSGKKVLGLVIARGGSKGLPGKNLKYLGGMPLVAHAISAGVHSRYIDDVIISTEDKTIAETAETYGCEVPFIRPVELASDSAKSIDVVIHALSELKKSGREYDIFVLLQPTTPFRKSDDIDSCLEMMIEKNADSVVSVTVAEHHPMWMNTLPDDLSMKDFIRPEAENKNRQDLPVHYRINGGIYAVKPDMVLETGRLYSDRSYAYIMSSISSIDIDSELDFETAELILKKFPSIAEHSG